MLRLLLTIRLTSIQCRLCHSLFDNDRCVLIAAYGRACSNTMLNKGSTADPVSFCYQLDRIQCASVISAHQYVVASQDLTDISELAKPSTQFAIFQLRSLGSQPAYQSLVPLLSAPFSVLLLHLPLILMASSHVRCLLLFPFRSPYPSLCLCLYQP